MDDNDEKQCRDIGYAVRALKRGKRVCRGEGWNGKGMWLALIPGATKVVKEGHALAAGIAVGESVERQPYIMMKNAQGMVVPWVASQSDALAEDWMIVE